MGFQENRIVRDLLKTLSPWERLHASRVAVYAVATGDRLKLSKGDLLSLRYGAQLHGIEGGELIERHEFLVPSLPLIRLFRDPWGAQVPLGARILAVADAFDSMTLPEDSNDKVLEGEALDRIKRGAGIEFDPRVVAAFLKVQPIIQPVGL